MLTAAIIVLLFCIVSFTFNTHTYVAFSTSIISYGLSYVTFSIGALIVSPLSAFLISKYFNRDFSFIITFVCIGIIQFLLNSILFRFKRLKKGMPFLLEKGTSSLGIALGIIIITATTLFSLGTETNTTVFMTIFILIVGVVTVFWWRKSLTQRYIEKIRLNEIENLESELAKLKTENEALAKIIHKDNKLIPAMEMSVREVLTNPSKDLSASILEELEKLSSERKGIILTCVNNDNNLPSTGFIRIDSLIKYMYQKCIANGIQFDFRFDCDMSHMLGKVINEDSFTTLIADLIENAIIATREQPVKKILFYISYEDNLYKLSFFDSGIHFDRSVILNLGKNKITTHAETGGSGIGLMSTMDIVRRHKGTFRINTELNDDTYTKQVLVTFSYVS